MGLNSKDSATVKEESAVGGCQDSGFARSSGVPRPLSNKPSALPHFMSLKAEQDEKPSKMRSDLLASRGYMLKSVSDILEDMHTWQPGNIQNFEDATMKQQFLGGNPLTAPHSVQPSGASVAGTTEQWINSKASSFPAQLTIFYGGTVNVFDDVSPEKAQAIIFLAGNVCVQSNMVQSKLHKQAPASKLPAADQAMVKPNTPPCSGLPSPMSVSSDPIDLSGVLAPSNNAKVSKTVGMATTLVDNVNLPRAISSVGSIAASAMISSAVPQARRASLARFLEKRKERVMNAAPYNLSNKTTDCATPESNGFAFSASSRGSALI